jgi:hypothetical protein
VICEQEMRLISIDSLVVVREKAWEVEGGRGEDSFELREV